MNFVHSVHRTRMLTCTSAVIAKAISEVVTAQMESVSRKFLIVVLLLLSFARTECVEPSCSKFDFEVKVLEKLVKLEYKVEQGDDKLSELEKKVNSLTENEAGALALGHGRDTLCLNRMTAFEGSCYFVGTTAVTLPLAQQFCQDRNSELVQIDTPQEQLFLSEWLAQLVGGPFYWIGATDINKEGVWTGLDDNEQVNFTGWSSGEPNGGINENCACLYKNYQFSWTDISCTLNHFPVCEYRS